MPDAAPPPASPRLVPGVPSALSPLVRRIVAPNPGPFTGPGTNTYLVGIDEVAVIDPGPDDEQHIDAIIGASMKERVRWVVLTHTHPDHAPGTTRLVKATGAEVLAYGKRLDKDSTITPDRAIGEGDTIEGTEFGLDVLHTPGHAPNHLCFLLEEERVLFTGDTVLDGMFSVVSPQRGGDMAQYLESLGRMEKLRLSRLAPGHGDVIEDARPRIQEYVAHRHDRERQVLTLLKQQGPAKIPDMVTTLYADRELHPKLVEAAGWQLHAHLLKLKAEGKVTGSSVRSAWSLA
jgi:glyoxylase-like metal-dependent hydrolase (beta-lactamase superfamily II)